MGAGSLGDDPATEAAETDRAARNRAVRWAAALLAVVTVACTAACAGPPSKGEVHGEPLNQSRNNVVILAREPRSDMQPELLVSSFLQALTGDQKDPAFSVAQEYLTADARAQWIPGPTLVTTTKIVDYGELVLDTSQDADHGTHPALTPSTAAQAAPATPTPGEVKTVTVSGPGVAQIDQYGYFQFLSQFVTQQFSVKFMGNSTGWRISAPPAFRMLTPEAFKRAYQAYQSPLPVYLPSRDSIPHLDQVYLTQATGKVDDTYDALARAVLHGRYPSQDSHLDLQNRVTVSSDGVATVTLKPRSGGMPDLTDVQRALLQTFRDASETPQLLSPTALNAVLVTYPGCAPSSCKQESFSPQSAQAPLVYWVCPQGQNGADAAILSRQLPAQPGQPPGAPVCPANGGKAQSVVGMTGVQLRKNSPIAVKQAADSADVKARAAPITVAVVEDKGSVVVLNDKNSDQPVWYTADDPSKVTDLEWDPLDGSLWVVDDGNLYRVRDPGDKGSTGDTQEAVPVPGQQVTRFKLSPDGQHAVVVGPPPAAGSPASTPTPPASMVAIDRGSGVPTLSADTLFQLMASPGQTSDLQTHALESVTDAAWGDGRTVVLLGAESGSSTSKLYKVYLDGSQDSKILDPEDAQPAASHIAAATNVLNGHPSLWTISEAPGPNGPATTYSYFKNNGGSDSFQEVGSSPVVATVTADRVRLAPGTGHSG